MDILRKVRTNCPSWRTSLMLLALAWPSAGLACDIAEIGLQTSLSYPWAERPCPSTWQARAGEFDEATCYKYMGSSSINIVEGAEFLLPYGRDYIDIKYVNTSHNILTFTYSDEVKEIAEIHDKGAGGMFINTLQYRNVKDHLARQLGQVLSEADREELTAARSGWKAWLLGDGRKPCRAFTPLDNEYFGTCEVELVELSGESDVGTALVSFRLKNHPKLTDFQAGQWYGAYQWVCMMPSINEYILSREYVDIWWL